MTTPRTKAEIEAIEHDKHISHGVFFVDCPTGDELNVESEIQDGFTYLRERALKADMLIVSFQVSQNAYYDPTTPFKEYDDEIEKAVTVTGCGHICITILAAWANREQLERAQLQEALSAGPAGPRRVQ